MNYSFFFFGSNVQSIVRLVVFGSLLATSPLMVPPLAAQDAGADDGSTAVSEPETEHAKLKYEKWSGDINVPDPVALHVDDRGRVFVTQTKRRKIQDLDIRSYSNWIPNDVGLQSVQDKRDFFHEVMAIGGDQEAQKKLIEDLNGDGQHDWRDLTVVSEVIYRLSDNDGDGKPDEMTVFADDFKTEVTGIAAGVMAFDGSVYATVAPDLWRLTDTDDDGVADTKQSIVHGFGLHIAYGGHDMHGLTVGPDGKIYWSIGDKGINVTLPDGTNIAYPNQGGVMRCNPDGSDFEVFAHGLRNVQEFAFDEYGNIFGVDNDADQPNERERFVQIVAEMDAGWRCNYQYRGDDYNPWTDERLWDLPGEQHAAYIVPPLQHFVDGPAGFKYNPGTALSPDYRGYFFMTSAPNGYQYAFRVEPSGDSFAMRDDHLIGSGDAIVGLAFGPDGGLYGADWDGGYPLDEKGSVIRIDAPEFANSESRREVSERLAGGFRDLEKSELAELLSHEDMRVRLGTQFELVNRGDAYTLAGAAQDTTNSTVHRLHGLWGLGQLGRQGDSYSRDTLVLLMTDSDARIRGQAAKAYGEQRAVSGDPLLRLLGDDDLQVRVLAGLALARQPRPTAVPKLLEAADGLVSDQHYLRHSLVTALAACASAEQLSAEHKSDNEMRRLVCVLALRRQSNEAVQVYLDDPSAWLATAAARAIHDDLSIEAALPKLAESLSRKSMPSRAFAVRAINANYRIGDAAAALRVVKFAEDESHDLEMRLDAMDALSNWLDAPKLDRVDGRRRELANREPGIDARMLRAILVRMTAKEDSRLYAATIDAAQHLGIALPLDVLQAAVKDSTQSTETRVAALRALADEVSSLVRQLADDDDPQIRLEALRLLARFDPAQAVEASRELILSENPLKLQQFALKQLGSLQSSQSQAALRELAEQWLASELPGGRPMELGLELVEALAGSGGEDELLALRQRIIEEAQSELVAGNPTAANFAATTITPHVFSRDGGDADLGEKLFRTHVAAQCSRCHRVGPRGSEIGPELTKIADNRDANYLLRSLLSPSAEIEEKYRNQALLLASGEVVKGIVQSRGDDTVVIADSNGELIEIPVDDIEEESEQLVSLMPDMSEILTPREIRDLVAYLKSLRTN